MAGTASYRVSAPAHPDHRQARQRERHGRRHRHTPRRRPTAAAPTPTRLAADVISLFSNTYTNVPVDTWSAGFDLADVADVKIAGNDIKKYTNLQFAGIEFMSRQINATSMTHFHLDVLLRATPRLQGEARGLRRQRRLRRRR